MGEWLDRNARLSVFICACLMMLVLFIWVISYSVERSKECVADCIKTGMTQKSCEWACRSSRQ